jgi:hypothetical protein
VEQDHVAWGAAFMLLKRHEGDGPAVVAVRIGELALADDMPGIDVWQSIAVCMDRVMRARREPANEIALLKVRHAPSPPLIYTPEEVAKRAVKGGAIIERVWRFLCADDPGWCD